MAACAPSSNQWKRRKERDGNWGMKRGRKVGRQTWWERERGNSVKEKWERRLSDIIQFVSVSSFFLSPILYPWGEETNNKIPGRELNLWSQVTSSPPFQVTLPFLSVYTLTGSINCPHFFLGKVRKKQLWLILHLHLSHLSYSLFSIWCRFYFLSKRERENQYPRLPVE